MHTVITPPERCWQRISRENAVRRQPFTVRRTLGRALGASTRVRLPLDVSWDVTCCDLGTGKGGVSRSRTSQGTATAARSDPVSTSQGPGRLQSTPQLPHQRGDAPVPGTLPQTEPGTDARPGQA